MSDTAARSDDRPTTTKSFTPRVFSGAQPSGNMHLGNYLGAFKNWGKLQDDYECLYCVVDLHAITVWQDPARLAAQTREAAAAYIAAGVDPERAILFNQSRVAGHAELSWMFNCVARIGWLNRMTQFKDKAGKNREKVSVGLYVYPTLMAADILLYKGTHVPVGEDQKQHLELTQDIAQKFNHDFGREVFPIVEPIITGEATRVMSLRDGTKKMSKSEPSDMTRINLTDDADTIAQKFRKARTDAEPLPETADGLDDRAEARNLVNIYAALADLPVAEVLGQFAGKGFKDFKDALVDVAVAHLSPVTGEMARLMGDPATLDAILDRGAEKAAALAEPVLDEVKETIGLLGAGRRG
ncbi:tryptophanyl-tRNA synthetase [Rhodothalassium salexigens DSM 2132]|uniref:Tryptophan--tRNA ligase n=1 Tax=Rhodothalassium salexigens DSM 2132 TaxID=1188247 RepID=A0A4R2PL06_RHOSA|nr:tryptophan--tRNA ligase [Rhodothalassium salexigens]MBB4211084.1 tryptophanyl-tRNA synthetase [Rhodothalassium salexigens DSM 2132]MBK1639992.1 tryptophan--tRNA ligase [Rhodothalassium salexigens DSM 2132]TCP36260.1 tryptophanyl-tRNA synthetase [Rhodothalassium salexigens DSM 2132]